MPKPSPPAQGGLSEIFRSISISSKPSGFLQQKECPTNVQVFMLDKFLVTKHYRYSHFLIFTEVIRIFTLDRFCILQLTSTYIYTIVHRHRYMIKLSYSFPDCEVIGNPTTGPADVTKTSFDSITMGHLAPGRNHPSIYTFTAWKSNQSGFHS